jgi:aldehyde dehydrogenase (NAD+)
MQEEIFGPILPFLTYTDLDEALALLKSRPKPLALYIFSKSRATCDKILRSISLGGGCINDSIIHLATSGMGFGGVGDSGMGAYHGKRSFDTFTHEKSIVDKKTWLDLPMRYRPFSSLNFKLLRMFLK